MPYPTRRLKFVADFVSRGNTPTYAESSNTFVVNQACVQRSGLDLSNLKFNENEDIRGFKGKLRSGDVLVNSTGTGTLGRSCLFEVEDDAPYFADGHVTIVRDSLKRFNPRFLSAYFAVYQELVTVEASEGATNQIELNREKFRSLWVPFPPMGVQDAVVQFIGRTDQEIREFVERKLRALELLGEQKRAIISRAVTCGINPDAPMKHSGLDWLGEIPAHWNVKRIKYFLQPIDQRSMMGTETLLSMRMYHGLVPHASNYDHPHQSESLIGFKLVRPGQLVVNRMQAGNGLIFCSGLSGLVSPDYSVFDVSPEVNPEYIAALFRGEKMRAKFRSESKGLGTGTSGFLRLYDDRLGAIHAAMPERREQEEILDCLTQSIAGINQAIAKAEREIALIEEFRTTLISEVVTGKRDIHQLTAAKEPL